MKKFESDKELIEGCLKQDRLCQKALYEKFKLNMMGVCMRYTNSKEEAEDILVEGFMKVFSSLQNYRYECSLKTWIYTIMVNNAITHFRKNSKMDYSYLDALNIENEYATQDITDEIFGVNNIMKIVQMMPPGYRVVFNLFAIEGYSHKEIAKELNISESTSKSQFLRTRKWLMQRLEK